MKFSKLLVLSALALMGLSANAADLVERVAPVQPDVMPVFGDLGLPVDDIDRTPATFEVGKLYVLYNVSADKFFYQGCNWATQGAVDDTPLVVRFTLPEGKTLEDAMLVLNDYNIYTNSWKQSFFDSATSIFTDRGSQANFYWQVIAQGDKTYRLQASEANPDYKPSTNPGFVGRDDALTDQGDDHGRGASTTAFPLTPFLEEGEGHHLDWQFFAVPQFNDWEKYFNDQDIYSRSESLRKQIEAAEALGVDVSAAVAVYNNLNSTVAEMQAAIDALLAAMSSSIGNGTADNPSDATAVIKNPNFDNASADGWSGTAPNMTGSGSHGPANVAEHYNKTFDTYQQLTGLPNGVYAMGVKTFFRGTWDDMMNGTGTEFYPYLYATVGEDTQTTLFNNAWSAMNTESMAGATEFGTTAGETSTVYNGTTYFIPNDPSAFRLYEEKGFYDTTLFFEVVDGKVRLGIKKDQKQSDTDWAVFDTFTLKYFGNSAESFQKWVELSVPTFNLAEGTLFTQSYMDAYNEALKAQTASNKAEALAAIEAVKAVAADLQKNISLWAELQALVDQAYAMVIDSQYDGLEETGLLADYCEMDYMSIVEDCALTNEELEAEIAGVKEKIQAVIDADANRLKEGDDVTKFMVNPGFENGSTGWTIVSKGGGNVQLGGNANNHCFEAWHSTDFDIYQEVKNMPVGVYEISVAGYVRYRDGQEAITYKDSRPESVPIYVYMNDAKNNLPNWFDYQREIGYYQSVDEAATTLDDGTYEYPDNMTAASIAFGEGGYRASAFGLVAKAGDPMRIGVKGNPATAEFWPIWDDFKLTYRGFNPDVVKPALENALAIIDMTKPMGKSVKEKASEVVAAAEAALAAGDGEGMFDALAKVTALTSEIEASVALFAKLQAQNEALQNAIIDAVAGEDVVAAAKELFNKIDDGIWEGTLENEDAENLIAEIGKMIVKLGIPASVKDASDANPVDLTSVIRTPGFETVDAKNSIDGWITSEAAGYNFGNDDTQKSALALEYYEKVFNLYQDIVGLPNGTYKLSCFGFERSANPAYLYGISAEKTYSVEMQPLGEGENLPNSMVTARDAFNEGRYLNEVVLKVDGEKLRIGIRKDANSSTDWIIMDDFKLTYYGANSSLTPDGDASGIVSVAVPQSVKVEYFTLDGRKATSVQKGILIQKVTFENGSVVVRKIRK